MNKFYLEILFPYIANLALQIEAKFPTAKIPFLSQNNNSFTEFTREQIAILIANCLFCTITKSPKYDMKEPHFGGIYTGTEASAWEKMKFFFNYFDYIRKNESILTSKITVSRHSIKNFDKLNTEFWCCSKMPLKEVKIDSKGKIEDYENALQVDFADPYIGGGVDDTGDQEQILFVIYPEIHIAFLTCERMLENEAIVISGFQRFSNYSGYGLALKYNGPYSDPLKDKKDIKGRIPRHVVGINATRIGKFKHEYEEFMLLRELNKAYIGFIGDKQIIPDENSAVSTGKWGCGAFTYINPLKVMVRHN